MPLPAEASSRGRAWAPGPLRPQLDEGAVDVWLVDLEGVGDDLAELLSPAERARARRFRSERDGRRWARAHGALRALLGGYLDADPRALRFSRAEHGKPRLSGKPARASEAQLAFNVSHSGDVALCAFTQAGEVGVDVEVARRQIDEVGVAARTFGAQEARRLRALAPAAREREFLRAWTRHEARLKCAGTGIGRAEGDADASRLWVADLEIGARAAGAVALERAPRALARWRWPG